MTTLPQFIEILSAYAQWKYADSVTTLARKCWVVCSWPRSALSSTHFKNNCNSSFLCSVFAEGVSVGNWVVTFQWPHPPPASHASTRSPPLVLLYYTIPWEPLLDWIPPYSARIKTLFFGDSSREKQETSAPLSRRRKLRLSFNWPQYDPLSRGTCSTVSVSLLWRKIRTNMVNFLDVFADFCDIDRLRNTLGISMNN